MKNKRNKIANFLKLGALLLGFSLLLWNCEKEEEIKEELNNLNGRTKSVSIEEIPKIASFLNKEDSQIKGRTKELSCGNVDLDNILQLIDEEEGVTNYTFKFTNSEYKSAVFYNYIITDKGDGRYSESILKYIPDNTFLANYSIHRPSDFEYFSGKIKVYSYASFCSSESKSLKSSTDPCPGGEISVGSSGGGLDFSANGNDNAEDTDSSDISLNTGGGGGSSCVFSGAKINCWNVNQLSGCTVCNDTGYYYEVTLSCHAFPRTSNYTDCPELTGSFTINLSTLYKELRTTLELSSEELVWLMLEENINIASEIYSFIEINKNNNIVSPEAKTFAQQAIEALMSFTITNYPGLSEGLPYKWWKDDSVIENNSFFNQNPYNVWRRLTKKEKEIFKLYPAAAIILNRNKKIAEQQTIDFYGKNGINDNSDAFRHAYFNALNSRDMGRWLAKKLSDAHESETPAIWSLEVQMDLFNNNIGHQAGHDFPNNNDIQMTNLIKDRINNGLGRYLDPVNYFDPNFWVNSLTGGLGTHGISSSTILKPTY